MTGIEHLRRFVKQHGTQKKAGEALGLSQVYVNDMLQGKRQVTDAVLMKLGLERVTRIRKLAKSA